MTREEKWDMLYRLRHALNPVHQVHLEAQLNCATVSEVRRIAAENGLQIGHRKPYKHQVHVVHDYTEAKTMYDAGATDREIADKTGIVIGTIISWRERHYWPANGGKKCGT